MGCLQRGSSNEHSLQLRSLKSHQEPEITLWFWNSKVLYPVLGNNHTLQKTKSKWRKIKNKWSGGLKIWSKNIIWKEYLITKEQLCFKKSGIIKFELKLIHIFRIVLLDYMCQKKPHQICVFDPVTSNRKHFPREIQKKNRFMRASTSYL